MKHQVVQLVKWEALFEPFLQWIGVLIALIKVSVEPAEHVGDPQIEFAVAIEDCWIDKYRLTIRIEHEIA